MNEALPELDGVRAALVLGVEADIRRRRRRRGLSAVGLALVLLGALLVSGTATGTGWLFGAPAPQPVAKDLHTFERSTPPPDMREKPGSGVPLGRTLAVTHGGGYTLYVLHTRTHECYEVDPNGGSGCGPSPGDPMPVELIGTEVHADPRVKEDPSLAGQYGGGSVAGRTATSGASTVDIKIPGTDVVLTAKVNPASGYFITAIPAAAGRVILNDDNALANRQPWPVLVRDRKGRIIAKRN